MATPYPSLYQINTRVWLRELSQRLGLGRRATLDDVPDAELDDLAKQGFDWVWLLSVWQTGAIGQRISQTHAQWRREFAETLPDLSDDDIPGSGFAVTGYTVHQDLGGDAALARLRAKLQQRGLKLMLDFVPNHTGMDHPWVQTHPEYYIQGEEADFARAPLNYCRINTGNSDRLFALGRDPYFPAWADVLQLNYGEAALQQAMAGELSRIAGQCDGVRCDMAMLVLPEIFLRTWGLAANSFWPMAIDHARKANPDFVMMAEVYWGLEWELQQQGFDYTYDKRLYDRLRDQQAGPVRDHLRADLQYQRKMARFLENHDEPRAAATFSPQVHPAAAVITYLTPGMRFFHQGQFEGRRARISPHLNRAPVEPVNLDLQRFYKQLLKLLQKPLVREGTWRLLSPEPAWEGNSSHEHIIAFEWELQPDQGRWLVVVNYSSTQSQCRLKFAGDDLAGRRLNLRDYLSEDLFVRDGTELQQPGLYLDLTPWQTAIYDQTLAT